MKEIKKSLHNYMQTIIQSQKRTGPNETQFQGIVLARGVFGCLLDTLFQFWTPYFICHLHVKVL